MKLHEALRALCQKHGNIIVQKKNLVYLISDMGAFEEFPGMREVMKVLVSGGFAKELCSLCLKNDRELFRSRAAEVKIALAEKGHFSEEAAGFAVDSVSFAFGFTDSVTEPKESRTDYTEAAAESGGSVSWNGKWNAVPAVGRKADSIADKQRVKAEQGDAEAQFTLGVMYIHGLAVRKDTAEGVKWIRRSAEQGYTEAQFRLGTLYITGEADRVDPAEGVKWLRRSVEQGSAMGQCCLGELYMTGTVVPKDEAEAFRLYRLAAEQGYAMAQNSLGSMYMAGRGVRQDFSEAFRWCSLAAAQGVAEAQSNLGDMYQFGEGVYTGFSGG